MKYKIYKLILDEQVVYVGYTTNTLNYRKSNGYSNNPYNDILKKSSIHLIEETDDKLRERYWIKYYRDIGIELLNIRGGNGFNQKEYSIEYNKKYRIENKEYIKEYNKSYEKSEKRKIYRESYIKSGRVKYNKEYHKNYRIKNKKEVKDRQSIWYENNKERILEKLRISYQEKKLEKLSIKNP